VNGTEDPIRAWALRRRTAQARAIEDAVTGPAEAEPPAVESLTAGAEPQAPPEPTMDDYMRDRDSYRGSAIYRGRLSS